jgi:hypothetical protein
MPFTTHENPFIRVAPRFVAKRYTAEDGSVYEETGVIRPGKKGEVVATDMSFLMGPAVLNRDTTAAYHILRLVSGPIATPASHGSPPGRVPRVPA